MRAAAAVLLAALAPMASGCIAAAALPLAAGAAVMRTQTGPATRAADAGTTVPMRHGAMASDASDLKVVRTTLTALPPPDAAGPAASLTARAIQAYAAEQASLPPSGANQRLSALLADPRGLSSRRAVCRAASLAVVVDLDPGRGTFDPLAPGIPDAALAQSLAALRSQGFAVVWISRLGENFVDAARDALARGGLDPDRRDQIVLMRTIDERKQTRREAIAGAYCPIALVGDERADFDELYLYLKQPDAAAALDALIGRGWFLANPFAPPVGQAGAPQP